MVFLFLLLLAACAPAVAPDADTVLTEVISDDKAESDSIEIEPVPYHVEPFDMDSRQQDSLETAVSTNFRQIIQMPGATWLRLHFSEYDLGRSSYLTITSLQDGGDQRLDSRSLPQWENATAVFNGDAVEIELHVDPNDSGVYFIIDSVVVGEPQDMPTPEMALNDAQPGTETLCSVDNRVASNDGRVGRLFFGGAMMTVIGQFIYH